MARVPRIVVEKSLCKKCYNCVRVCTAFDGVYEVGGDGYPYAARPELCIQCLICHSVCPTSAIRHEDYRETLVLDLSPNPSLGNYRLVL